MDQGKEGMVQRTVIIGHRKGLHARPAALVAEAAGRFSAEVRLIKGGREVNAKNVLELMMLAVGPGEEVTIAVLGEDGAEALATLARLLAGEFTPAGGAPP